MKINILIFAQLTDIIGSSNLVLDNVTDTDNLVAALNQAYPELTNATYLVSVNKKMVTENLALANNTTVALLPPFSGG